jgi:U3 small nucleolar RNA-associated protein 14
VGAQFFAAACTWVVSGYQFVARSVRSVILRPTISTSSMARQNKRKASATVASRATTAKKRGTNTTRGRRSSRNATTVVKDNVECAVDDVYEAEDVAVDEEVHRDRYDELDDEYELPEGFEDEEIDEDEAFNSEDERQFGHLFEGGGGKYSDFDSEEEEEDAEGSVEEEDGRGAYDALVSDEDEDDEVWPDLDGGRAGAVVREPDDAFEDGGASRGGYDNGGDLDDDDDDDGDGLDTLGEFDGDKDVRLGREERVEMIRELYPESIYAVGPGA